MDSPEAYADIITDAEPTYVESKAAMAVGFFSKRLPREEMPTHNEIRSFAEQPANLTGYRVIDESRASSVMLLSKLNSVKRLT